MVTLTIVGFLVILLLAGRINLSIQFNKEVKRLFSLSKSVPGKTFSYHQIAYLPEPVQRYFRHVLREGQPYISYIRLNEGNLESWIGRLTAYKEMNGIIIPTNIEAIWQLEKGDFSYAKFNVKVIEYDKPEKF